MVFRHREVIGKGKEETILDLDGVLEGVSTRKDLRNKSITRKAPTSPDNHSEALFY